MKKIRLLVLVGIATIGAFADTLVWTGGGDGTKWSDAANWSTTPDWDTHPASASAQTKAPADDSSKIYDFDFTAATDGTVLDNDCTKWVGSMTFGANKGTITVKCSYSVAPIQGKKSSVYTVPAGTTVINQMPYSTYWGCTWAGYNQYFWGYDVTVTGGGEYRIDGTVNGDYNTCAWTFDGVTVHSLKTPSCKSWSLQFTLRNGAKFYLDNTLTVGAFKSESATDELILAAGKALRFRKGEGTFAGKVSGAGDLRFAGGTKTTFTGDWSDFTGTIYTDHGDLELPTLPAAAKIVSTDAGVLTLDDDTTVAALAGNAATGGITLKNDAELTVDTDSTELEYGSRISGAGSFVKDGAGTLTLVNDNRYDGATRVKAGKLVVRNPAVEDGLYAYFPFDFDIHDHSGNGRDLSGNAPTFVTDAKRGKCAQMNGGLSLATPTCISGNHPYTVAAWAKITSADANHTSAQVFGHHYEWSKDEFGDTTQYRNGPFIFVAGKSPTGATSIGGMSDALTYPGGQGALGMVDEWHHYLIVQTETQRKLYFDGVLKSTVTRPNGAASGAGSQPWNVSAQNLSIGSTMTGCLDEVLVYSRALSEDEIAAVYRDLDVPMGAETAKTVPQPIAHYAFDDETDMGKDSSGNGYDLTYHGSSPASPAVATGSGIYGKAWNKGSSSVYFELDGELPARFPRGNTSFTVQLRANFASRAQDTTSVFLGSTADTSGTSFQICGGDSPVSFGWSLKSGAASGVTGTIQDFGESGSSTTWAGSKYITYTFVYDASASKVYSYRDGALVRTDSSQTITLPTTGGRFVLGCNPASWKYDQLKYDDVQIFDCALTAAEVKEVARSIERAPGPVLPAGTAVTIDAGAELEVRDYHQTFASLGGAGTVYVPAGASVTVGGFTVAAAPLTVKGAVSFAANGVIDLGSETKATLATFTDPTALEGADNLQNWTVKKNGKTIKASSVEFKDGALMAKQVLGLTILFR